MLEQHHETDCTAHLNCHRCGGFGTGLYSTARCIMATDLSRRLA